MPVSRDPHVQTQTPSTQSAPQGCSADAASKYGDTGDSDWAGTKNQDGRPPAVTAATTSSAGAAPGQVGPQEGGR